MTVRFDPSAPYEVEEVDVVYARPEGKELLARAVGADTLELNLEPSAGTILSRAGGYGDGEYGFAASEFGAASVLVPAWAERLLADR